MSIKAKLSFSISLIVAIILLLSLSIHYFTSKAALQKGLEEQVDNIAKQISMTIESSEKAKQFMENTMGEKLRIAAIAAKEELGPDINKIKNEQLVALSRKLGVDHITLWKKFENDIIVLRSSQPNEINMSSKTWDYHYTAFNQLFNGEKVTVPQGQKLEHFWSAPFNFATSDPKKIIKWGNYYDGTTNYMINPYVNAQVLVDFDDTIGTDANIKKIISDQPTILEITGFDPEFFNKPQIIKFKQGVPVYNLDVRAIAFGQYRYKNNAIDTKNIQKALHSGKISTAWSTFNGKEVLKSFIPITNDKTYVVGITFDYPAIQRPLSRQILIQALVSIGLVLVTLIASYFIAGFMMRSFNQILNKVNAIAVGNFDEKITIRSNDEFGLLASRVDTMGNNLNRYTTELKDAAEELQSTKQYLESFVNHTTDAIHVADLTGKIIQVNKAFEVMYGWRTEEIIGQVLCHIPDNQKTAHEEQEANVLLGGSVTDFETQRYTKSGELIDLSITISSIHDELGAIVAIASISRNITSRKQTEEMIRRSEKLSVVGQIAAGVAHEVRNPLTTLRGFVQLQKQSGPLSPTHLDIMLQELDQINMIVSEFLVFAKPQANRFQPVNIQHTFRDVMLLLELEAKLSNVQLILKSENNIPQVIGEANQLKQVFVNVIKNGMESMPSGGMLTIKLNCNPPDRNLVLEFCDQGCGIAKEDLLRLGEPFFTKKPSGNGLGIMVSQQIIEAHKGTILFSSKLGEGTCVKISLPIIQ